MVPPSFYSPQCDIVYFVLDFVDRNTMSWKVSFVTRMLRLFSTCISFLFMEKKKLCHILLHGNYSVNSGYFITFNYLISTASISPLFESLKWKIIRKLKVQLQVKHFLWCFYMVCCIFIMLYVVSGVWLRSVALYVVL